METDALAKKIAGELISSFTNSLKSLNPFSLLEVIFIVELYYLMINSLFFNIVLVLENDGSLTIKSIPNIFLEYNATIMKLISEYANIVFILSICMFICGASLYVLRFMPIISNYKLIYKYCGYGISASIWLLLMWLAYNAYLYLESFFFMFFIGIFCIGALAKFIGKKIKRKLGFEDEY